LTFNERSVVHRMATLDVTVVNQNSTQWPVAQILGNHFKLTVACRGVDFCNCLLPGLA